MSQITDDTSSMRSEQSFVNPMAKKEDGFYIGSNEIPSTQLVPFKMDGLNFPTWWKQFRMVVNAKKKLGFFTGSIVKPLDEKEDYEKWSMCNDMVHS